MSVTVLHIAFKLGYITDEEHSYLYDRLNKITMMVNALKRSLL
jgi:hypothetical protein